MIKQLELWHNYLSKHTEVQCANKELFQTSGPHKPRFEIRTHCWHPNEWQKLIGFNCHSRCFCNLVKCPSNMNLAMCHLNPYFCNNNNNNKQLWSVAFLAFGSTRFKRRKTNDTWPQWGHCRISCLRLCPGVQGTIFVLWVWRTGRPLIWDVTVSCTTLTWDSHRATVQLVLWIPLIASYIQYGEANIHHSLLCNPFCNRHT